MTSTDPLATADHASPSTSKLVRVSTQEAIYLQWEMIANWKPRSDTWPFTFGNGILASASALTGGYFNNHYRRVAKLGFHGRLSTLLPAMAIPSLCTVFVNARYVSTEVLISTSCPVCVEMRAVGVQLLFGIVYPLIITPLGVFSIAARYYTYNMSPIIPVGPFLRHWWKITSPRMPAVCFTVVLHTLLAIGNTYAQYNALETIYKKMNNQQKNRHTSSDIKNPSKKQL